MGILLQGNLQDLGFHVGERQLGVGGGDDVDVIGCRWWWYWFDCLYWTVCCDVASSHVTTAFHPCNRLMLLRKKWYIIFSIKNQTNINFTDFYPSKYRLISHLSFKTSSASTLRWTLAGSWAVCSNATTTSCTSTAATTAPSAEGNTHHRTASCWLQWSWSTRKCRPLVWNGWGICFQFFLLFWWVFMFDDVRWVKMQVLVNILELW